ncbi:MULTISPECIES: toxin-antitoxin system HicB family antitoxin [unclassified Limnobacter]|uniref:toxin-antitoxin system HicB family antitoxin n=1 Tax=unclassified Limnobacter TaxID=2630203 RepID=UPI000C4A5D63|nr:MULTISPECIES: toxin-antitoxin system HicB family antitoxin [unclassified Limnobacter]MAZ10781.1 toxin-antitoxin system HicB family antitoxin [Sutterellaceae bacterium]|tara:strand:- start:3990 stop:4259 length:270 start_codon:yes stop_codon:yes gene_type:complete
MAALTVRLSDEKHARLKALAKARGIPLNALIDEMTTQMLAEFDAETRFQVRAMRGMQTPVEEGLHLLAKARGDKTLHDSTVEYKLNPKK